MQFLKEKKEVKVILTGMFLFVVHAATRVSTHVFYQLWLFGAYLKLCWGLTSRIYQSEKIEFAYLWESHIFPICMIVFCHK